MGRGTESMSYYRLEVAARLVGLPPARVRRYLRAGLVRSPADDHGAPVLGEPELARLRQIRRLTTDLGLNQVGVEVVLRLLDEIVRLQTELHHAYTQSRPEAPHPFAGRRGLRASSAARSEPEGG